MSDLSKPLYTLTIGEYIELNNKVFSAAAERILHSKEQSIPEQEKSDIIFMKEAMQLTGYKRATLYSKVCRFEIPVLSRRKPLTFSRKALTDWINDGKPNLMDQEADKHLRSRS